MTNKQMDEKIRDAFEAATPNVLGSILAQCAKQKRNITVFKQRRSIGWTRRFITVSGATILILVLVTGLIDRLPPIMPTGPLFTGTDPTGTNPTQPDALTWVDWGMNATWVLKNGTPQGQYPMQIKGLIENKKETRLKLEIYTPDSFGYQFTLPDDGYTPNALAGLVEHPGDYYDSSSTYSIKANKFVKTHWAISTTKEYFIAYWPENPGLFLVGAGDPNVSAAEVMAYFDAFVEEFRTEEPKPTDPEPTDPDNTISVDWSMNASWIMPNGYKKNTKAVSVKGTIKDVGDITYLNLGIDEQQNPRYKFTIPEPYGYVGRQDFMEEIGDFDVVGNVYDTVSGETVRMAFAVSTKKEYFIFVDLDHPEMFLVGATKSTVSAWQIMEYFELFVDHYRTEDSTQPTTPKPTEPENTDSVIFDPTLPLPNEFPTDLLTDEVTLSVFQEFFDENNYARQASGKYFEDPTKINLHGFFYAIGMVDDIPVTEEDRKAIVDKSGVESFYDRKAYCLSAEKMNQVLLQSFGVPLSEMTGFANLYYLESSGNYCYFHDNSPPVAKTGVMGVRFRENGNVEVYYVAIRAKDSYPKYYGVITMKSVGDTYHILSNEMIDVHGKPIPAEPVVPNYFPADMETDPMKSKEFFNLFRDPMMYTNFWNVALRQNFADSSDLDLVDLFYNGCPLPGDPITQEELEQIEALGVEIETDITRCVPAEMDKVLNELFGISLADFGPDAFKYFIYLESTDCYYFQHGDANYAYDLEIVGYRNLGNGNVEVFYQYGCGSSSGYLGTVTLKPHGDGYRIISNEAEWVNSNSKK